MTTLIYIMHYRRFGRTEYKISVGAGPGIVNTVSEALNAFKLVLNHGLNIVDI